MKTDSTECIVCLTAPGLTRPYEVQRQMERARMRGDWAEWRRLARTNEAR